MTRPRLLVFYRQACCCCYGQLSDCQRCWPWRRSTDRLRFADPETVTVTDGAHLCQRRPRGAAERIPSACTARDCHSGDVTNRFLIWLLGGLIDGRSTPKVPTAQSMRKRKIGEIRNR